MTFEQKLAIACFVSAFLVIVLTTVKVRRPRNQRVGLPPPADACRRSYPFNDPPTRSIP